MRTVFSPKALVFFFILSGLTGLIACSSDSVKAPDVISPPPVGSAQPLVDASMPDVEAGGDDGATSGEEAGAAPVTISPPRARVTVGRTQTFAANVKVSWSVLESGGGTIDETGLYVAPGVVGTFHVIATSADLGVAASAEVVSVSPGLDLVAGAPGGLGTADGIGADARFFLLAGAWLSPTGELFVADSDNETIRKVKVASREVTTIAGSELAQREGGLPSCADGVGATAGFARPRGTLGDGSGALYVGDQGCFTIRKIDLATGMVTTVAGKANTPGQGDGVGAAARFEGPTGLAWASPNVLFVADGTAVRTLNVVTGEVATVEGTSGQFTSAAYVVYDGAQTLFVTNGNAIEKVDLAAHASSPWVGNATQSGLVDGDATNARFYQPYGMILDGAGNLIVADNMNNVLRKVDLASGAVSTFAGHNGAYADGTLDDGVGTAAGFALPSGIVSDGAGGAFVTEVGRIRRITLSTAAVTTIAGENAHAPTKHDPPGAIRFTSLGGVARSSDNELLVSDASSIRPVLLADGETSFIKLDTLIAPSAVAVDKAGVIYIADVGGAMISTIARATGTLTPLAGSTTKGFADGVGSAVRFHSITSLFVDDAGSIFVTDDLNCAVRKIEPSSGLVTTVYGSPNACGSSDGDASTATFWDLLAITGDAQTFYLADGSRIRAIDRTTNVVSTLAGSAIGFTDGVGVNAHFSFPGSLALDGAGNLFVADRWNSTIRKIDLATKTVTTVVGLAGQQGVTLGPLSTARLNTPVGLLVLPNHDLIILDGVEGSILRLRY